MFVFYAFLVTVVLTALDLIYIKTFQLENYDIKKYIKKAAEFDFAFGKKNKINFTKRLKRLIFIDFLLKFIIFLMFFGLIDNFWINFVIVFFFVISSSFAVLLSFFVTYPFEELIKKRFIKKAKKKLSNINCKKIAITGSYGKTSTKNILYQILKEEFDVCATPQSFNTPMGICKTILENLKETDDFLIVEYGARRLGDIEFLAKNFGVDFGIITPIGNCHLETFGCFENIEQEKYELCKEAKEWVVFNGKSKGSKDLFDRFPKKKYLVCENNSFAYAKNIEISATGSKFDMVIDGQSFACETKLLGKANIDNIVVASAMAYLLNESIYSIRKAIKGLKPTPHRLELIVGAKVSIIDDSFNSNYDGFLQALEIISKFKGQTIVVSPGIVELGVEQDKVNFEIGKEVGKVADIFIVMNKTNQKALSDGAKQGGMSESQIFFADTRDEQKKLLKKVIKSEDVVLFENDFPDNIK